MQIIIQNNSSIFGLTTKTLRLSGVQQLLRQQGVSVRFPNTTCAVLESEHGLCLNATFAQQVEDIKNKHLQELQNKSTTTSKCFNVMMIALGVAVMTTGILLINGLLLSMAALIGIYVGIGAVLTVGLFQFQTPDNNSTPRLA